MANKLSMDEAYIIKLTDILEVNLENEQFGVEELAEAMGMSRSQLHRKLNVINGKSTSQFIREFRLKKAMEMLQNNVATSSEIAYRVGFNSPTYFNTTFHQYYGYPPGEVKLRSLLTDGDKEEIQPLNENTEPVIIKRRMFNLRIYAIATLALILITTFAYFNYTNSKTESTTNNGEPISVIENSIAVLPFKNMSGSPDNEAFCDGMTTAIISRLSKIKGINKVISQTSMMSYKDNQKTMPVIADELKVHYILESGFQKSGNDIKINLQLIEGISDKLIWSEEYEGKYDSIFKIQARVAEMVAKQLNANVTAEEHTDMQQSLTNNTKAYKNYLMGQQVFSVWTINSVADSRKYFEMAIEQDSLFAEAYFNLGMTYSVMGEWNGNMTKTQANILAYPYLEKALQLDPNNPQFINFMAFDAVFDWNFKRADSLFHRLDELGFKNNDIDYYYFMLGDFDVLVENYFKIIKDPLINEKDSFIDWKVLPYAFYYRGEIDESIYAMEKGLHIHPNLDTFYDHYGNVYLAMGNYQKAKEVLETGLQISGKRYASMVIHLAAVYHYLGDEGKSKELLNEVIDRANKGEPEINVFVAHYYARLGNKDEAFKWLDKAYDKHEVDLIWLKADPNLLKLKEDPRYKVLCQKVGFPGTEIVIPNKKIKS